MFRCTYRQMTVWWISIRSLALSVYMKKLPVCECAINNDAMPNKLSYDDPKVWDYVYKRMNFSPKLDCLNSASINIFHIYWGYLKDCIYELPELDTMVIAEQRGRLLNLLEFSQGEIFVSLTWLSICRLSMLKRLNLVLCPIGLM